MNSDGVLLRMQRLPPLSSPLDDATRESLVLEKLMLCEFRCNFKDVRAQLALKHAKRTTLLELVEYIGSESAMLSEKAVRAVFKTVSKNIFRALSPHSTYETDLLMFDPEEDDPVLEEAWPHLQIVYELFLQMINNDALNMKIIRKFMTTRFLLLFIQLFDAEDPREREYVKTITHRIYGKVTKLRPFIRQVILQSLQEFAYEQKPHQGIGELLEILGSIINGFSVPLKPEHRSIMQHYLVPLHASTRLPAYHMQLCFCLLQFVEKDPLLARDAIQGMLKLWPKVASRKEVLFVNELEELLEMIDPDDFDQLVTDVFKQIAKCIQSPHFQVAERALFFWNNESVVNLMVACRNDVVPLLFDALFSNAANHWNHNVQSLSVNVLRLLAELDPVGFEKYEANLAEHLETKEREKQEREFRWRIIIEQVEKKVANQKDGLQEVGDTKKIFRSLSQQHIESRMYRKTSVMDFPESPNLKDARKAMLARNSAGPSSAPISAVVSSKKEEVRVLNDADEVLISDEEEEADDDVPEFKIVLDGNDSRTVTPRRTNSEVSESGRLNSLNSRGKAGVNDDNTSEIESSKAEESEEHVELPELPPPDSQANSQSGAGMPRNGEEIPDLPFDLCAASEEMMI